MPPAQKRAPRGSIVATNRPLYLDAESLAAWEFLGAADLSRQDAVRKAVVALAREHGWPGMAPAVAEVG